MVGTAFMTSLSLGHVSGRHTDTQRRTHKTRRGGCEVNCGPVTWEPNTDKSVRSLRAVQRCCDGDRLSLWILLICLRAVTGA